MFKINKWVILSSGNVDLLHAAVANAIRIGVPEEMLERFDVGSTDVKSALARYLTSKSKDTSDAYDIFIPDIYYMTGPSRFRVLNFQFLCDIASVVTRDYNLGTIVFSDTEILGNKPLMRQHGIPMYCEVPNVDITDCMLCLSTAGAKRLLAYLHQDSETLPTMYFISGTWIKKYQWEYKRGYYENE